MRQQKKTKIFISPDFLYNDVRITKFINHLMKKGKKELARRILYKALKTIQEKTKEEPLDVFGKALENVKPLLEVKSKRIGGATYQVPRPVSPERGITLAMRWILETARKGKGKQMSEKLAEELIEAAKNRGPAIKKKENMHRMAEANRAFAHFAW